MQKSCAILYIVACLSRTAVAASPRRRSRKAAAHRPIVSRGLRGPPRSCKQTPAAAASMSALVRSRPRPCLGGPEGLSRLLAASRQLPKVGGGNRQGGVATEFLIMKKFREFCAIARCGPHRLDPRGLRVHSSSAATHAITALSVQNRSFARRGGAESCFARTESSLSLQSQASINAFVR
jgi:hypothetical protein